MTGIITDIQRFSLNDGPGIRTSVFFKGCNMSCMWCHNPETISPRSVLLYYPKKCINCLKCAEVCPSGANLSAGGLHVFDRSRCIACMACAEICYPKAFAVSGRMMSLEEVMGEIIQDKAFYIQSGGGVTFTGGEVFCQKIFLDKMIDLCRDENISTAIETNFNFPFEFICDVLKKLDLLILDIKITDPDKHKEFTLENNKMIFENIKKINALKIKIIVRTPVIPNINDNPEEIGRIARLVGGLDNLIRYELLNYNPLGSDKYDAMGLYNKMNGKRPLSSHAINILAEAARTTGIEVGIN